MSPLCLHRVVPAANTIPGGCLFDELITLSLQDTLDPALQTKLHAVFAVTESNNRGP
jgi:hypothetical protein